MTATKTKKPTVRTIRLHRAPVDGRAGKVTITVDGEATTYFLDRQETEIGGVAWQLRKIGVSSADGQTDVSVAEVYNVLLDGDQASCCCPWSTYKPNAKPCRHISGLLSLMQQGRLS